jgi:16S rRNA (guanine966-N2)-methyltransferase
MRIIGGKLRGRSITLPVEYNARPTTDFAKEGLFNILMNETDLEESAILDLFSGTGAISFEFASRGCKDIISIEMAPANAAFIKKTAKLLDINNIHIIHHNVFDFVQICAKKFDIVFADPPYTLTGLATLPDCCIPLLKEEGIFILEHPGNFNFESNPCFYKEKKYGNVHFSFFKAK